MNRILVADDHALLRSALKTILESSGEFVIIGEARHGLELLNVLKHGIVPDVLILDLTMPEMSGIEALCEIRRMGFDFKILALTMNEEKEFVCLSFCTGANGYMLKETIANELISGIHDVLDGKIYLSPRMKQKLPDTCNFKANAGRKLSTAPAHCK